MCVQVLRAVLHVSRMFVIVSRLGAWVVSMWHVLHGLRGRATGIVGELARWGYELTACVWTDG